VNIILLEPGEVRDGSPGNPGNPGTPGNNVKLSGARAHHLLNVLKVAPGHHVRVGILDGPPGVGTVQSIGDNTVDLRCAFDAMAPPRPRVDLLLALPRPKVMRRLWAQVAALGVGQIILTNAERVERNYFDAHVLTPGCYRPLLIEGLQQARDTRLPTVSIHRQFKVLIEDDLDGLFPAGAGGPGQRLVADPAARKPAAALVRESIEERILLAVGPEGGWNAFETALLEAHGFEAFGMGPRTLRTDTACVALLAIVLDAVKSGPTRV
jgi:16S rRNA (uracil1498-N3)-methyltransferase